LKKANIYFLALETMTISGSTPLSQRLGHPQANIDSYKIQQSNAFTTEAEHLMLQKLIDAQQLILDKMPDKETAQLANSALAHADDGPANSLGINVHNAAEIGEETANRVAGKTNPPAETNTDKTIGETLNMKKELKTSFREVGSSIIQNGHIDANSIMGSLGSRLASKAMDSATDSLWKMLPFANGGVVSGGFRAFASGGAVTKPTLGLVGEGKYNEAVVPLPDGKSIPVIGATGAPENNITVNVTVDSDGNASSDAQGGMNSDQGKQLGYMVSQAVQAELVNQQRPGGLLSSY
jgi:hypothetical protein